MALDNGLVVVLLVCAFLVVTLLVAILLILLLVTWGRWELKPPVWLKRFRFIQLELEFWAPAERETGSDREGRHDYRSNQVEITGRSIVNGMAASRRQLPLNRPVSGASQALESSSVGTIAPGRGQLSVPGKPRPNPCFLDGMIRLGAKNGELRWRSSDGKRFYTWDYLHGEIEVFNKRGRHLGALDAITGRAIKDPVEGRTIDVS